MNRGLSGLIRTVDRFGETINFQINGRPTFTSWPGTIITLIIYILTFIYAQQKFVMMLNYEDTNF